MPFDKKTYDIEYARKNVTRKFLAFNRNEPEDVELLCWLDSVGRGNVNDYVKQLIRDDMNRKNGGFVVKTVVNTHT